MVVKRLAPFVSAIKAAFWSRWERPVIILLAVLLVASIVLNRIPNTPIPLPKVGDKFVSVRMDIGSGGPFEIDGYDLGKVTAVNGTAVTFVRGSSDRQHVLDWGKVYCIQDKPQMTAE